MEQEDTTLNDEVVVEDKQKPNEINSETKGDEEEGKTFTKAEVDERVTAARKGQDKIWKEERIPGLLKGQEDSKEDSKKSDPKEVDNERYDRLNLKTEGIKEAKEQDIVLDYAKFKGISIDEAINTPAVKAELKEVRTANSTPAPSQRSGTGVRDEVSHDAAMMSKGERLPTAERRKAAREYLSKK